MYAASAVGDLGAPDTVQLVGESEIPKGRLVPEDNAHDVTAVPSGSPG